MHRFERAELTGRPDGVFSRQRTVAFQDVDAAGIVFYPRIFVYAHDAYADLLARAGHALPAVLALRSWAAPIRHAEADYLRPLRFGDELDVAIVRAHFDSSEMCLGTRIAVGAEVAALIQTVHTFVDRQSFRRIEIPADVQSALRELVPV